MISNGKEGMSKLKFACRLFLFRHGLHGKHRFSLFFSVKSAKSVPKRNHQMYFDTLSFLFMKKTMCTLSDAYDKKTEEWKREVFRIRGSLRQERIPDKKGRKLPVKCVLQNKRISPDSVRFVQIRLRIGTNSIKLYQFGTDLL